METPGHIRVSPAALHSHDGLPCPGDGNILEPSTKDQGASARFEGLGSIMATNGQGRGQILGHVRESRCQLLDSVRMRVVNETWKDVEKARAARAVLGRWRTETVPRLFSQVGQVLNHFASGRVI